MPATLLQSSETSTHSVNKTKSRLQPLKGAHKEIELPSTIEDLRALGKECAVYWIRHNAEPDAVDLLEELEIVHEIAQLVDDNMYDRVCQYMI
ncbi:hypothetical protein B0H11DRAFT_2287828, partial [Mycena galericulata]